MYTDKTKEYRSYFNETGYEKFLEKTLPLITEWLDKDSIKIDNVKIYENNIIYQDEYQVVIEIDKIYWSKDRNSNEKSLF